MRKLIVVTLATITLFAAGTSFAQKTNCKKQCPDRCSKATQKHLEKNIQLVFRTIPKEKGDDDITIMTAIPWFAHKTTFTSKDEEAYFAIEGSVAIVGDKKILLNYSNTTVYESNKDNERAEMNLRSGIILTPGKEATLGSIFDKKLVVTAKFLSDKKPAKKKAVSKNKDKKKTDTKNIEKKKSKKSKKSKSENDKRKKK